MVITPMVHERQRAAIRELQRTAESQDWNANDEGGDADDEGGKNWMSITGVNCCFPFPGETGGNTRLWETCQFAHLAMDAFLKFFSSVILRQCFAILVLGADATDQTQLLQGNHSGISSSLYVHFWCRRSLLITTISKNESAHPIFPKDTRSGGKLIFLGPSTGRYILVGTTIRQLIKGLRTVRLPYPLTPREGLGHRGHCRKLLIFTSQMLQ